MIWKGRIVEHPFSRDNTMFIVNNAWFLVTVVDKIHWVTIKDGPFIPKSIVVDIEIKNHPKNGMVKRLNKPIIIWKLEI